MTKPDGKAPAADKPRSGEVRHDARGHAVWEWAADTARNAITSTSQLLRKLDLSHLTLEEEKQRSEASPEEAQPTKAMPRAATTAKPTMGAQRAPGTGFNPYEPTQQATPAAAKPAGLKKAARAPAPAPRSWWRRLFQRDR